MKAPTEDAATPTEVDNDPGLRDLYLNHWLQCEFQTATCPVCLTYTKTDYFNHNYRRTEPLTSTRRTPPFSQPWDYPSRPAPTTTTTTTTPNVGLAFKNATSACPYSDPGVTFISFRSSDFNNTVGQDVFTIQAHKRGRYVKSKADKIQALLDFKPGTDLLLVAWPGQTQDIFAITTKDQRDKALTRLGLKPRTTPTTTFTAADGTVFEQN